MKQNHNTTNRKTKFVQARRLLALLAMLCYGTLAWAQTEWNGSATNGTFTISGDKTIGNLTIPKGNTLTLNITGDNITFQFGTITLSNGDNTTGANLNLNVTGNNVKLRFTNIMTSDAGNKTKAGKVTLNNSGSNFIVNKRDKSGDGNNSSLNLFKICKYWSLEVIGTEDNPVTFDGEWTMAENGIPTDNNQITNWKAYGVYYSYSGDITFRNVKVKNFVSNQDKGENGVFRYSGSDSNSIMTTELTNVEIYQCYAGVANINSTAYSKSYGRIIGMNNGILVANCDNLEIHHCFVHEPDECEPEIYGMGGVIRSQGSVGGTFTIKNSSFHHNTYMNRNTNQLTNQGGVINWRSGMDALGHEGKLVIKDCKFYNNKAKYGGAISTNGRMDLERVKIYDNEAVCGGGVFFWTYNGRQPTYDGQGFNAVFGEGVDIYNNTATEYGGGAYLTIDASHDVGFNANKQPISPLFQVQINTGCTIHDNKAPKGAGIAIKDGCPYSHYNGNDDHQKWSGEYQRTVTIDGGEVYNNYADETTGDEMAGAGIYIEKYEYPTTHGFYGDYAATTNSVTEAKNNSGTLTVNLASGKIYNNTAINSTIPGYGGGVYIGSKFETNTIKSTLNVNIGEEEKDLQIYKNQAYTDGGGVYVLYDRTNSRQNQGTVTVANGTIGKTNLATGNKALNGNGGGLCVMGGTVSVNGGNIEYNTAGTSGGGVYVSVPNNESITTIQKANISNNTANNGNGGGVCLDQGRINIYGSNISNNTATTGGGGGVYTHDGDITVWPDYDIENTNITSTEIEENIMPKGTKVTGNKAGKNGGGLNTHKGRFDVRFATITNNEAGLSYGPTGNGGGTGGNGGGLFCEGPHNDPSGYTVRLLHCHLNDNKVYGNVLLGDDITGRGGGIYLKKGSIFAEHCDILRNEADINGGGLDNHEGELRVYGSYIDHNKAKTGRGGGIYTEEGNIVVGPCDSYGFTASKASRIQNNTAYLNGGGINNHHGDITIHGDRINYNTAETGDGGGVYIKSGQILMYGGQINNNKADQGKGGGVYGGSGKFNIMEREPHPILEILEVENITIDSFIVHFHHVDRGLAMESGATAKEFGIAYSTNPYPNLPANQEWNTTNWSGVTKITFNVANGNSDEITTAYQGEYSYVRNEGCSRVTVKGLSAGTYYVVAYGKYSKGGKNYFDASPALKVVIPSSSKAAEGNHPKSIYPAVDENPFFMELTPLQQAMLASTPEGDSTEAPASGATTERSRDDDTPVNIPQINGNTARYGGRICIDQANAELVFSGTKGEVSAEGKGQINKNFASEAGGGIYIGYQTEGQNPGPAKMQMMGKCEVNYNHVPASKQGGGIYLDGRLYVGDQATDAKIVHGLKVNRNFASDTEQTTWVNYSWNETYTPANSKLNNVFLPRSEYEYPEHENSNAHDNKISVITLLSDISGFKNNNSDPNFNPGEDEPYSCIGFSVLKGFCPVIATAGEFGGVYANVIEPDAKENWMYQLMRMSGVDDENYTAQKLTGAIFEDSESYVAVHTRRNMQPFLGKFIYLWGCWTHPIVKTDPETKNPMSKWGYEEAGAEKKFLGHYKIKNPGDYKQNGTVPLEWEIYSPEGLAWFTSYVNGLNAFDEASGNDDGDNDHHAWNVNQNPKAKATIMNDLDMSAYLWVPIGSVQKFQNNLTDNSASLFNDSEETVEDYTPNEHKYCGKFDGQGHIIKGLQGLYLTGIKKFGLFGYLTEGAEVKNTFVDKGLFMSDNTDVVYAAGGIAGEMDGGTLTNSEARMNFNATYSKSGTTVGGLVGDMKGGSIHSCMAMPSFTTSTTTTGQYVGGLVGKMDAGTTLKNSFSNVLFTTVPAYKVGGIVGDNKGIINNVYVRYNNANNTPNLPSNKFYWIAGNNSDKTKVQFCFAPYGKTGGNDGEWYYADEPGITNRRLYKPTKRESGKYGFAHKDQEVEKFGNGDNTSYIPTMTGLTYDQKVQFNGLVDALNNWVAENNATNNETVGAPIYTPWTRTMASTINDDYPVLMFNDFNVVGTEDGIYMKYDDNVNDMWKKPNYKSLAIADRTGKDFQGLTSYNNPKAAMYLYKTNGVTNAKTTPVAINVTGNTAVPLHIHEDIGITQETGDEELTARVGVTFDNSNGEAYLSLGGEDYDWHMFSSALKAAPVGITYNSTNTDPSTGGVINYPPRDNYTNLLATGINDADFKNRRYMDPPVITWNTAPGTVGYFPTDTPYGKWGADDDYWPSDYGDGYSFDFYCFHEPSRHWINFKREGTDAFMDHWHEDIDGSGKHQNLWYVNESTLQVGKGYMMGVSKVSILMADGILNNGDFKSEEKLSNSLYSFNMSGYSEELRGLNLVGNPYQSYLDFKALVEAEANEGIIYDNSYHLFDADHKRYISYTYDMSENTKTAPRWIHPHQGFFIRTANDEAQLSFKNTMRAATGNKYSYFRGQNLNYPLVNLLCYDVDGFYDLTTVEMNRPKLGGGEKLKDMRFGNSLLYASVDGTDYQTLFAPEGTSTVAVRFKASQNGVYTMRWETMHGDFQHLHLIDNLAGVDVDCLKQSEYRFEATTTDYLSRFKLVFDVTDVEENADEAESATFAFQMGDELVVNGSGELSVFDVQGRCIASQRLAGTQSSISLPRAASGMYILRLTGDKQVKTQKLIIK